MNSPKPYLPPSQPSKPSKSSQPSKPYKVPKPRCMVCRKKLGMMIFTCKCHNMYCASHQSPHSHECSYDHKKDRHQHLYKVNPPVIKTQVDPI